MKNFFLAAAALLLISVPLSQCHAQKGETLVDGVAAVVGRHIVKYSDIERAYAQVRVREGVEKSFENRCSILENLILNDLLLYKGEIDSVEVTDDDVKQYVDRYLKNDMQQYGTKEALREATGFTYDELKDQYERMIRDALIARKVQYQITESVKITPAEVTEFFKTLPSDSLPVIPERYELSEIVIQPKVSEAERERVRTQLAELRERIIKGEKFSMLATLYSQDPGSARKGGELGFTGRGEWVSEFESAAFALNPGEVSPIIETQFGFHILQLIEQRGNTVNVRHILLIPKVQPDDMLRARMTLDSLAAEIRSGNISFEEAARLYSTAENAKQGGSAVNPADGTSRFDKAATDQYYYGVGVQGLDEGQISQAARIKVDDTHEGYCIVRLNKKYPAHKANLTDDYDNIYNAALANAQQNKLRDWAQRQAKNTYVFICDEYKDCVFENLKIGQ